jgi:hypothetical protein
MIKAAKLGCFFYGHFHENADQSKKPAVFSCKIGHAFI